MPHIVGVYCSSALVWVLLLHERDVQLRKNLKAQLSEAGCASRTKHNSCGIEGWGLGAVVRGGGRKGWGQVYSFRYGFSLRTTRQWIKLRPNHFSSDSTDHVKPGGHFALGYRFECHEPSLYLVIAWLATRIFLLKVQSIILNEASSSFFLLFFQRLLLCTIMYKCMLQEYTRASVYNISVRSTSKHSGWGLWLWKVSLHMHRYETHVENAP